jgi:YidC/Oxa1 family membrane protein insertase
MDRNQATGLVLIFAILFAYFTFFAPDPPKKAATDKKPASTTAAAKATAAPTLAQTADTLLPAFTPTSVVLENKDLRLRISTLGGVIEEATLKVYKTYSGKPLSVFTNKDAHFVWNIQTAAKKTEIQSQAFAANQEGRTLVLTSLPSSPERIVLRYQLDSAGYVVQTSAIVKDQPITAATLSLTQDLLNTEKDFTQGRTVANTTYLTNTEDFDHLSESSTDKQEEHPEKPLLWVTHKTKFFLTSILSTGAGFTGTVLESSVNKEDSVVLKTQRTQLAWQASDLKNGAAFKLYLGPNDYKKLGSVATDFEKNVYLGWPIIRWVNKYIVVNVFHFLQKSISNYGIIIILLVIFIRIILLPLGYTSYLSMAKMRVLKPELDEIKAKHGEDMTAIQQDQMKLYQQVGINPLSGCIPLLLQMPILLAMFNFLPNSIELRQEHLFWAEDLSAWDSIATLPFSLPGYGSHVSLFTILMTLSTLAVTYVNASATTVTGPMASMQYIMPVVFMFILNSFKLLLISCSDLYLLNELKK